MLTIIFRSRAGLDVALEALRAYAGSAHRDLEALRRHARIDGVERVLQPYLEATVARATWPVVSTSSG